MAIAASGAPAMRSTSRSRSRTRPKTLPANHPVTLELRNPRGQLVQTITNTKPVGQFYAFELKTAEDAPTGDWNATAIVGGATFAKTLKVETVMPNRLKIELDLGDKPVIESSPLTGTLELAVALGRHGRGPARQHRDAAHAHGHAVHAQCGLHVRRPGAHVQRRPDHACSMPRSMTTARRRSPKKLDLPRDVPGMLNATFITRVFERGGAFSINRESRTLAAFDRYVGVKLPKGDAARDMLLTDTKHTVELATVNTQGEPVSVPRLQVTLYKVQWRWWWEQSGDSLAQYAQGESDRPHPESDDLDEGWPRPVAVRDQVSRVGPVSGARLRSRRRALHRPRVLHRLAELGRRAARPVRTLGEHPHDHVRQAGVQGRRDRRRCSCPKPRRAARCSRSKTAAASSSSAGSR